MNLISLENSPTLLVLAGGMATRYGQLKQFDRFGTSGETILDYSVYDAIRAGFKKIVFVIRESIKDEFLESISGKFASKVQVVTVSQELDALPAGFLVPKGRTKPWGTGHAIWVASRAIDGPFAVINADDFYGRESFHLIADFLKTKEDDISCTMVGYQLENTLSEHGSVSRGICQVNKEGYLDGIVEHTHIWQSTRGIESLNHRPDPVVLNKKETVSMNLMGFSPAVFPWFETYFTGFLQSSGQDLKAEFYLPEVVNNLIKAHKAKVKVLPTSAQWFGVTYPEDKPVAVSRIKELVKKGRYPDNLWE